MGIDFKSMPHSYRLSIHLAKSMSKAIGTNFTSDLLQALSNHHLRPLNGSQGLPMIRSEAVASNHVLPQVYGGMLQVYSASA